MPQVAPAIETFARIKVIGVGGAGGAAVNRMVEAGLKEKSLIENYLPQQLSDESLREIISSVIADIGAEQTQMGQIIAAVKSKTQGTADGARIAQLVKDKLLS